MANVGGKRSGNGERTRSHDHVVEEIVPSSAWTFDQNNHYLLVDLPDFKKEEMMLEVDESNQITVRGKRLVNDKNKYIYFEKTFKVPDNSDIGEITGKYDGGILCVTVPKKLLERYNEIEDGQNNTQKSVDGISHVSASNEGRLGTSSNDKGQIDEFNDREILKKWENGVTPLARALEMLRRNKGISLTAVIAFSLGMLVSRGINSSGQQAQLPVLII